MAFAAAAGLAGRDDIVLHHSCWGDSRIRKAWRFVSAFGGLVWALTSRRVTLVYFTSSRTKVGLLRDAILLLPSRLLRRPRIVNHLHGSDFLPFRARTRGLERRLLDFVYRRVDCSIVLDRSMAEQYAAYPAMEIEVVPNFVPNDLMSERPDEFAKPLASAVEVLFLSNLIPEKGVVDAIRAVDALAAKGIDVRLTVAGKPDGRSALDLARAVLGQTYEFGDHIRVVGPLYGQDKADAFRRADIFVLPTYYESEAFPLTVLEAMAFGCAIVLSSHRYLPSIFGAFGATFVPPRSWEAVRDALEELIRRPEHRTEMGRRNWNAALAYTQDAFQNRVATVLESHQQKAG